MPIWAKYFLPVEDTRTSVRRRFGRVPLWIKFPNQKVMDDFKFTALQDDVEVRIEEKFNPRWVVRDGMIRRDATIDPRDTDPHLWDVTVSRDGSFVIDNDDLDIEWDENDDVF